MIALQRDPLGFFAGLGRAHGDLAFFRWGPIPCVFVNRPEWVHRLLTKDDAKLRKSWDLRQLAFVLGQGLLMSEGEFWKHHRQLIQPAFLNERVRSYAHVMVARTQTHLEGWRDGQTLCLHEQMSRLTLDIAARTLFGTDVERDAEIIDEALTVIMAQYITNYLGAFPIPIWLPTPGNFRAKRAVRSIDAIIYRMLQTRRASPEHADDLLSWLVRAADDGGDIGDREVRDELVTLLLAGHETTALVLSWTLMLVAQHPEVEQTLLAELRDAVGDRPVAAGDETSLRYTRQVIEESMRLYPPAWGLGREAKQDIELGGHLIRKGTQVYFSQWVTHRDPAHFPEPTRFDPMRWSPERRKDLPRHAYFPFSSGPRVCIGAHFALLEATLVLAAILQRFHVDLVPGHPIEPQPAVTLRPRHGIRAVVTARA